jgi:ADP-L-glycero-D-manno-heptose 6-epimerase
MASVLHHFTAQIRDVGSLRLFGGTGGYRNGEQRRDFVYVRDLVHMNMFFAQIGPYATASGQPARAFRGLANAGSGRSRTFNDVARALMTVHGECPIHYIPFPPDLEGRYQHFTEADMTALRELGYDRQATELEAGIAETYATMETFELQTS